MSRKGKCWGNAVSERFFLNLKMERVWQRQYANHGEAIHDVADYIVNFYYPVHLHSTLGYLAPNSFEQRAAQMHLTLWPQTLSLCPTSLDHDSLSKRTSVRQWLSEPDTTLKRAVQRKKRQSGFVRLKKLVQSRSPAQMQGVVSSKPKNPEINFDGCKKRVL